MSYSELKYLAQLLAYLNFPVPVSIDSFHTPNFRLASQILQFLLQLALPDVHLSLQINTSEDRVYFVTTAVQLIQQRLHLKLSAKRLYAADQNAAHELLKLAHEMSHYLCYQPPQDHYLNNLFADLTGIATELRNVASELVEKSTNLLVYLRSSGDTAGQLINYALAKQPDVIQLYNAVQARIGSLTEESRRMDEDLMTSRREKLYLQEHLTYKTGDNSRMVERLESIRTAKPPFIAELEQVEQELTKVHEEYVKKHRSLNFLESQLKFKDYRDAKKRILQDMNRKTVYDIISKQEKEDIMGGASSVDPFMITPGPKYTMKDQVKISNAPIPEPDEEEYEYEEEEIEEQSQAADSEPIDSNENLSDVLDNDTQDVSSAANPTSVTRDNAQSNQSASKTSNNAEDSPDILHQEQKADMKKADDTASADGDAEEQEYEYEEEEVVYEYEEGVAV